MTNRSVVETNITQGEDEVVLYSLTTTPWGSSPTSPAVALYSVDDYEAYTDVTATNLSGDASVSGDIITLPTVTGLTAGVRYRCEITFVTGGNTFEAFFYITCER